MTGKLTFEDTTVAAIEQDGGLWLLPEDIGAAIGYSDARKQVTRLYRRHADEFSESMTCLVYLPGDKMQGGGMLAPVTGPQAAKAHESGVSLIPQSDGLGQERRVFSLRGAHLIAILARTDRAKKFRVWILDLIEAESQRLLSEKNRDAARLVLCHELLLAQNPRWARMRTFWERGYWTNAIASVLGRSFEGVDAEVDLMVQAGLLSLEQSEPARAHDVPAKRSLPEA